MAEREGHCQCPSSNDYSPSEQCPETDRIHDGVRVGYLLMAPLIQTILTCVHQIHITADPACLPTKVQLLYCPARSPPAIKQSAFGSSMSGIDNRPSAPAAIRAIATLGWNGGIGNHLSRFICWAPVLSSKVLEGRQMRSIGSWFETGMIISAHACYPFQFMRRCPAIIGSA